MKTFAIPTSDGTFAVTFTDKGLAELRFPEAKLSSDTTVSASPPKESKLREWLKLTKAALLASLAGHSPKKLPPLDLSRGTEFQRQVWAVLRSIAPGRTLTYGEVAAKIHRPRAMRAVGGACGANPVAVIVPCHRVLAASRKIGGFSGGLEWKRRLLQVEGALPPQ